MIQIVKWLVSLILISQLPYKLVKQTLLTNILIWPNISINQSNKLKVRSFDMWNTLVFLDKIFLDDIYKKLVVLKKWKEKKKFKIEIYIYIHTHTHTHTHLICWVVSDMITITVIMSRYVKIYWYWTYRFIII